MNELTPKLPQELQKTLEQYYSSPMPQPEFASRLEAQLRQKVERTRAGQDVTERMSFMKLLRTRPLMAILVALLILLVLSGVAYALGHSLGYIPGLGIVDQSDPMRVLAEPASQIRDGVTITVKKVIVNMNIAEVVFNVDGLPSDKFSFLEPLNSCLSSEELRFPNGESAQIVSGSSVPLETGFESDYKFAPVPVGVEEATLFIPCIQGALTPGVLPENWELPLRLVPAPASMHATAIPVTEYIPLVVPMETTGTPEVNPISITKAIDDGDSYILIGEFIPPAGAISSNSCCILELFDGNGQKIEDEMPMDIDSGIPTTNTPFAFTWVRKFKKENVILPVIVKVVDQHWKSVLVPFEFDAGDSPQPGDEWQINQPFDVDGVTVTLENIHAIHPQMSSTEGGYSFLFTWPLDQNNISLQDISMEGYPPSINAGFGGGGSSEEPAPTKNGIELSVEFTSLPKGKLTIKFTFNVADGEQQWTLPWQP